MKFKKGTAKIYLHSGIAEVKGYYIELPAWDNTTVTVFVHKMGSSGWNTSILGFKTNPKRHPSRKAAIAHLTNELQERQYTAEKITTMAEDGLREYYKDRLLRGLK